MVFLIAPDVEMDSSCGLLFSLGTGAFAMFKASGYSELQGVIILKIDA